MITGAAKIAGVIGWPIAHSLSPRLHGFWLRHYQIDGAYVPMAVRPERLKEALAALVALGFTGANITIPHKEAAFAALDDVSEEALRIGAVNTVVVGPLGRLVGSNTDAFGFFENLTASCPKWRATAGPAVVLGAGGGARAVAAALLDAGAPEIRLINRDQARAERIAAAWTLSRITIHTDRTAALASANLLVNTTSLGMSGHPPLDIDLTPLPTPAPVCDIVYMPLTTLLLAQAAARGHPTVDGLGMLLHQARPGFRAWFGVDPEVTPALRAHLEQALAAR